MPPELEGLWRTIVIFLNNPIAHVGSTVLGFLSAGLGIWATRRASKVLHTHEQQILVTQLQLLNGHWQQLNYWVLTDEKIASAYVEVVGDNDPAQLRQRSFKFILINILLSAYASRSRNIMPENIYDGHFKAVAAFFKNGDGGFFDGIDSSFYTSDFLKDCERRFRLLQKNRKR